MSDVPVRDNEIIMIMVEMILKPIFVLQFHTDLPADCWQEYQNGEIIRTPNHTLTHTKFHWNFIYNRDSIYY